MGYEIPAFVIGLIVGFARRGSLKNLGSIHFAGWPLLLLGVIAQTAGQQGWFLDDGYPLVFASYLLLGAFVFLNIRERIQFGMLIFFMGLLLNFVVITTNGGMPVSAHALRELGATDKEISEIDFKAKRHLADSSDELRWIGDVLPISFPAPQVLSPGDVLLGIGVASVIAQGMVTRREDEEYRHEADGAEIAS